MDVVGGKKKKDLLVEGGCFFLFNLQFYSSVFILYETRMIFFLFLFFLLNQKTILTPALSLLPEFTLSHSCPSAAELLPATHARPLPFQGGIKEVRRGRLFLGTLSSLTASDPSSFKQTKNAVSKRRGFNSRSHECTSC